MITRVCRTTIGGRLADAYLRRYGIRPRERLELNALEAIAVMVDRSLGVSSGASAIAMQCTIDKQNPTC